MEWNLSPALIEGRLDARTPGLMTGWLRLAGVIGDRKVSVEIEGIPVAIAGHGFVLTNEDPACIDEEGLDGDELFGELEEFRWSVDARPPLEESDEEESWLDLSWRGEAPHPEAERGELHSLYLRWQLPSGDSVVLEAPVSKVILLRTRRAG